MQAKTKRFELTDFRVTAIGRGIFGREVVRDLGPNLDLYNEAILNFLTKLGKDRVISVVVPRALMVDVYYWE